MADRPSRSRAVARAAWLGALIAVPSLLAGVALLWPGPQLADDLRQRSTAALDQAGLGGVTVTVAGRDVELREVPAGTEAAAVDVVGAVLGVRVAHVESVAAAAPRTEAAPTGSVPAPLKAAGPGELPAAQRQELASRLAAVLGSSPIVFWADSAVLAGGSADTVQRVAELLRAAPAARIELEGHAADTPGPPKTAQDLSEQRAAVVADALVAAGVDRGRITTVGRADHEPLGTQAASRRVEISVR